VYKLVYARPSRNPSAFEQFYNDGGLSYAPAAPLRSEAAETLEASLESRIGGNWTVVARAYHYNIEHGSIQSRRRVARSSTRAPAGTLSG
jgi:hypothetical protein